MQLTAEQVQPVTNRLRRAHGQLGGIIKMLEDGRECEDVVTQLAAASKAIDRAGFRLIALGLQQCLLDESDAPEVAKMERLFLSLAETATEGTDSAVPRIVVDPTAAIVVERRTQRRVVERGTRRVERTR